MTLSRVVLALTIFIEQLLDRASHSLLLQPEEKKFDLLGRLSYDPLIIVILRKRVLKFHTSVI